MTITRHSKLQLIWIRIFNMRILASAFNSNLNYTLFELSLRRICIQHWYKDKYKQIFDEKKKYYLLVWTDERLTQKLCQRAPPSVEIIIVLRFFPLRQELHVCYGESSNFATLH